ncbi:MAG: hypothetical protein CUN49_08825 [Candidatus Thermofonsia Clade 1 bacterium]|uniref:Uncharacterized protein n=1 Tax=Candidatus Thermofonsia Clade 1 bacterium TaxID=2364210 RepID=A0A2M8PE02_9CHLR|nr:MAG: hypothetical protein CUN49_08825 [Candidatus Thermofonsia Clade 1 bacterium]PJF43454.1 MAG: hypothetical protein CUN50_00600 [Candidatus Thermofonsia Clade 1 bacterium]RMF50700.1 MAG: hypothetical protein D6749_09850 [Chloroflexota bacterium]
MQSRSSYHILYVPPELSAEWLLVAARRYWQEFRPIVLSAPELLTLLPGRAALNVTVIARRDFATALLDDLRRRVPRARFDPLVYDTYHELQMTLDGRAALRQRFGTPE